MNKPVSLPANVLVWRVSTHRCRTKTTKTEVVYVSSLDVDGRLGSSDFYGLKPAGMLDGNG